MYKLQHFDLMTGNWFCYNKPNNYFSKVISIHNPGQIKVSDEYCVKCFRDTRDPLYEKNQIDFFNIDILHPIQLTNYILGNNDFVLMKPDFMTLSEDEVWHLEEDYGNWYIDLENQCDDNGNEFFVSKVYSGANNSELYIRYVHQLQNQARICGITEEIISNPFFNLQ